MPEVPKKGDRSARDCLGYPLLHASDLEAGTPVQHLPDDSEIGQAPRWNGTQYVPYSVMGGGVYDIVYNEVTTQTIYTLLTSEILTEIRIEITETWNGVSPSLLIGISSDTDLFFSSSDVEMTELFAFSKTYSYNGGGDILVTFNPGSGASQGKATISISTIPEVL